MCGVAVPRARSGFDRAAWGVAVAASMLCALGILIRGSVHDWVTGDTKLLVAGMPGITHCVTWHRMVEGGPCQGVSKFPLLQQAPAYVLHLAGISPTALIGVLVWLNALAVVGLVTATAVVAHRIGGIPIAVVVTLLMTCGILLPYTAQSFGEPLAAAGFGALTLASLRTDRPSRLLIPFAVLATWSKETSAPFVFLLALAALGLSGAGFLLIRRVMIRVLVGIVVAEVAAVDFNWIRYHSIFNQVYLSEPRAPHSMWPSNGAGMLVSPNAGVAWFWPGVVITVVALFVVLFRPGKIGRDGLLIRLGAASALVAFAVMVASLAVWWSPFGWYAWGPRLLVPIAAAMVVLAIPVFSRYRLDRSWLSLPGAVALAIACSLTLMPNVAVIFKPGTYLAQVAGTVRLLPECAPSKTYTSQTVLNRCSIHETWSPATMPLTKSVQKAIPDLDYIGVIAAGWVAIVLWLLIAYQAARRVGRWPSVPSNRDRPDPEPAEPDSATDRLADARGPEPPVHLERHTKLPG